MNGASNISAFSFAPPVLSLVCVKDIASFCFVNRSVLVISTISISKVLST